jgi:hypothetical protein
MAINMNLFYKNGQKELKLNVKTVNVSFLIKSILNLNMG